MAIASFFNYVNFRELRIIHIYDNFEKKGSNIIMTRIEKLLFSRRHAQETSFCWSPFPEERLNGNDDVIHEEEVAFLHDETRRCRLNQG